MERKCSGGDILLPERRGINKKRRGLPGGGGMRLVGGGGKSIEKSLGEISIIILREGLLI